MKKIIFLLAFLIITLLSCSKSNNDESSQFSIIGKWDLKAKTTGATPTLLYACEEQYNYFEYLANKVAIEDEGYTNGGTECRHYTYNETYTISNNILTTKEVRGTYQHEVRYNIIELTATKLKTKLFYSNETYNGSFSEYTFPENEKITYSFDKIN